MTRLSILILSVLVITFLCVINVTNIHANDSVYVENEEHGQPPNTANHLHQYVHSPPKPFDRKGTWHGTVHYDWGWYQGPWLNGRWHTEEGEVGHCHHCTFVNSHIFI